MGFGHGASMGPRPFSRGNAGVQALSTQLNRASMGPRPFSRGNESAATSDSTTAARLQWGHGLSAVEIGAVAAGVVSARLASMGPRPFSRGNGVSAVAGRFPYYGGFNGATAFQPWKSARNLRHAPSARWLQWGHGLSAVEIVLRSELVVEADAASMGPRPFSRGNGRREARRGPGPRSFNGATAFQPWKSERRMLRETTMITLQWGHGLSAVEIRMRDENESERWQLQWGHGLSAVEISVSVFPQTMTSTPLQWGHGLSAVEICFNCCSCCNLNNKLQWGHGLSAVEMRWTAWPARSPRPRFNGATAFQPWKSGAVPGDRRRMSWLQWGHGLSAVEIGRILAQRTGAGDASMGPRPFSRGNSPKAAATR